MGSRAAGLPGYRVPWLFKRHPETLVIGAAPVFSRGWKRSNPQGNKFSTDRWFTAWMSGSSWVALFYHLNHLILPSPHPIALSANLCRSFIVRDCAVDIPFCFKSFCFDATFFGPAFSQLPTLKAQGYSLRLPGLAGCDTKNQNKSLWRETEAARRARPTQAKSNQIKSNQTKASLETETETVI